MTKKKLTSKKDKLWTEAKRRCRLSAKDIRMAKRLGLNPRKLIKNIPSKSQPWKAPVRIWIRNMYAKRFGKTREPDLDRDKPKPFDPQSEIDIDTSYDEDLLPQWDTVNEEPYFRRDSDGAIFSLGEAGQYFIEQEARKDLIDEDGSHDEEYLDDGFEPSQQKIDC